MEIKLGNKTKSAEYLSSALEAIKVNSQHFTNEFSLSPYLGRCLYLSGSNHFHAGDPVLAEGLFRAALDKFNQNASCEKDTR